MYLMKQLAEIKENSDHSSLDQLLKSNHIPNEEIYRIMNEAVDLNEMRFLSLLILLAADICFQFREFNRSFYFYNQAVLPSLSLENLRFVLSAVSNQSRIIDPNGCDSHLDKGLHKSCDSVQESLAVCMEDPQSLILTPHL